MPKQINVRRAIVMRPEDLLPDAVNCAQVDGMTIRKGTMLHFCKMPCVGWIRGLMRMHTRHSLRKW